MAETTICQPQVTGVLIEMATFRQLPISRVVCIQFVGAGSPALILNNVPIGFWFSACPPTVAIP